MRKVQDSTDEKLKLEQPFMSKRDSENGEEPGHPTNSSFRTSTVYKGLAVVIAVLVVIIIALGVRKCNQSPADSHATSQWPDGWFRNQGKYYYFSKAEGNWTYSQSFCSSHAASLTGIDDLQALNSLLPYKGKLDHWIGFCKDVDQVWNWANSTKFDHRFEIQGGADCAFLDEDFTVGSSSCITSRKWICSKPDTPTKKEECVVERDS